MTGDQKKMEILPINTKGTNPKIFSVRKTAEEKLENQSVKNFSFKYKIDIYI